jgi:hypothetical protein
VNNRKNNAGIVTLRLTLSTVMSNLLWPLAPINFQCARRTFTKRKAIALNHIRMLRALVHCKVQVDARALRAVDDMRADNKPCNLELSFFN